MDAKALFKRSLDDLNKLDPTNNASFSSLVELYSQCLIAEAITNSRDMICQKLDDIEKALTKGIWYRG